MISIIPISDTHLESNKIGVVTPTIVPNIYVLAGDIHNGPKARQFIELLLAQADVVYVLGNHEFYNHRFPEVYDQVREMIASVNEDAANWGVAHRATFLQNESAVIQGVRFIGATLWTDLNNKNPIDILWARHNMRDYRVIDTAPGVHVTPEELADEFAVSKDFITKTLETPFDGETVVVTHHMPSYMSVSEEFKDSPLNGSFVSSLDDIILKYEPTVWIHGHTHCSCDYMLGNTNVVCNPYGYPHEDNVRERGYDKNKLIIV